MADVLRFFKNNEVFIYLILGITAVWQIRKFTLAWDELRSAAFGLEQESARARLNWAVSMLVLIILLGIAEFSLVSFVIPGVPDASPLLTPTLDLLATATTTLGADAVDAASEVTNATPAPTIQISDSTCIPDQIDIVSPKSGDTISNVVEIYGTANIPNFGFYKFEMAAANNPTWQTVQAGDVPVQNDFLGYWDTSRLGTGDYALRLIVTDNQGNASAPCSIQVRVDVPDEP